MLRCVLHAVCDDQDPCTKDTCSIGDCDEVTCTNDFVTDDCVDLTFDGLCANLEESPGGFLCRNDDDDDNGDDSADKDDTGPTVGENDLRLLTISADGSMEGTLTLSVPTGGTHIRIWQNADRSGLVTLPVDWPLFGAPKSFFATLYVEGVVSSNTVRDVTLKLTYAGNDGTVCDDVVNLTVFDVKANDVDASDPHQAKVTYQISPPGLVLESATFTAPGTTQQATLLSSGFSFAFDQADIIGSGGTIQLQGTSGAATCSEVFSVSKTDVLAPPKSTLQEIAIFKIAISDTDVLVEVLHGIFSRFAFVCYEIDTAPGSKTLWFGFGLVNISTTFSPEIPTAIAGWTERLTVSDSSGQIVSGIMMDVTGTTVPAQSPYYRSKDLSLNGWSVPNNGISAVGRIEAIIFTDAAGSGDLYFPVLSINKEVDIALEQHGHVPTSCP